MKVILCRSILFIASLLVSLSLMAQGEAIREVYEQAEDYYNIGRLEQALELLHKNIHSFHGSQKQRAYRLMSLCYLSQDDMAQSEAYGSLLLKENPYYTSVEDPARFADMIDRLKKGLDATITTASIQSERLEETPVPVTLITEEMIHLSGARNLKELLLYFVPGMSNVECNEEMNIAMRGVYSSGQEKMLVMLNGHRLNSYSTNVARLDFSISLDKIKQVEVLRGPGSSLYGGVALTAVVNIITKSGYDVDGVQFKGGVGNYGQLKGDLLFGKHLLDFDVLLWGDIYHADGEKYYIPLDQVKGTAPVAGDIIIGGYNTRPTYNYGTVVKWADLSFMYNSSFTKYVAPYSLSYFFSPYSYDKYFLVDGNLPGYANKAYNAEISYSRSFRNLSLSAAVRYDFENHSRYQVVADRTPDDWEYWLQPNGTDVYVRMKEGGFQCLQFTEENVGAELKGVYEYNIGEKHHGHLTAGAHFNKFTLIDASNYEGIDYNKIIQNFDKDKNVITGSENSSDAFLQLKHQWRNFIVNVGMRFDYKKRMNGKNFYEFSPRVALVLLRPKWSVKFSYAKSFVDAPYFYRYNGLDTFRGGEDMLSEYLHSLQLTLQSRHLAEGLNLESNFFVNKATNLVHPEGMMYYNSGKMMNMGVELSATYKRKRLMMNGNATWQHLIESEDYKTTGNHIYNIPEWSVNWNTSYRFFDQLIFNLGLGFCSSQKTTLEKPDMAWSPIYTELDIPARFLLNAGARYSFSKFGIGAHVYNVLNHGYEQGGTSIGPIRQQGLWAMLELSYKL